MKRTFWTQNLFIGVLMGLVMVFGMQDIAEALTLRATSDKVQSNLENSEFEISFSVGLKSDTTPIKNDAGKLIDDGDPAVRIDSSGYLVTETPRAGTAYRNTGTESTVRDNLVPPVPTTPATPSDSPTAYAAYTVYERISSSQYRTYTSGAIYADSGRNAFSAGGYELYYYTPAFTYTSNTPDVGEKTAPHKVGPRIKIGAGDFATPRSKSNRYHYNDEAIAISVSTVAADGTLTASTGMPVRLKSGSTTYPVNIIAIPASRPANPAALSDTTASLWEGGGIRSLPSSITLVCMSATANQYRVTITDVSPENDFPDNAPETLEQTQIEFTIYVEADTAPTATLDFSEATGSLLRVETRRPIEPIHTHFDLETDATNLPADTSIRYKVTKGSGLLYVGTPTREDITPVSDLTIH